MSLAQAHAAEVARQAEAHREANAAQEQLLVEARAQKDALLAQLTDVQSNCRAELDGLKVLAAGDAAKQARLQTILGLFDNHLAQFQAQNKAHAEANADQQSVLKTEMDSFRGLVAMQKSLFAALQSLVDGNEAFKETLNQLVQVQSQQARMQQEVGAAAAKVQACVSALDSYNAQIAQAQERLAKLNADYEAQVKKQADLNDTYAELNRDLGAHAAVVASAAQALSPLRPAGATSQVEGIPATPPVPVFVYQPGGETGGAASLPGSTTATPVKAVPAS